MSSTPLEDPGGKDSLAPGGGSLFRRPAGEIPVDRSGLGCTPDQVLGGHRLIRPIGSGGMGQVWLAEDEGLRRQVALKVVRPDLISEKMVDLFAREARAGGRLNHPGLVKVLTHGEEAGVAWIAMEYVEGSWTLRDFLDQVAKVGEASEDYYRHAASFVARVADALHAAHEGGVIHRDLKPQNILITPSDEPKVTDFGLARITDESLLSRTGDFAGTYAYMSPEQVAARRIGLDHRTDVFSLGVVLYEMLAMRRPFDGDTAAQVGHQIMQKDPPGLRSLRSLIPRDLDVIVGKCLEKDRDRRYDSMAAVAQDLRRHLGNEPILARPAGRLRKVQLWARRNPAKTVAATMAIVGLSAVGWFGMENARIAQEREEQARIAGENAELARVRALDAEAERDRANGLLAERNEALAAEMDRARELEQVTRFQEDQLAGLDPVGMGIRLRTSLRQLIEERGLNAGLDEAQISELLAPYEGLLGAEDLTRLTRQLLASDLFLPALDTIESAFKDDPVLQGRLLQVVSMTMTKVGLASLALEPMEKSVEIQRRVLGAHHPDTLEIRMELAWLVHQQEPGGVALDHQREILADCRRELEEDHQVTQEALLRLGSMLAELGELAEAEATLLEALEVARRLPEGSDRASANVMQGLAQVSVILGDHEKAESLMRESLEVYSLLDGEDSEAAAGKLGNLGLVLQTAGKFGEAEEVLRESLELEQRQKGSDHPATLAAMIRLSNLLREIGLGPMAQLDPGPAEKARDEAARLLVETLEGERRVHGDDSLSAAEVMGSLGVLHASMGRLEEAEALMREGLEIHRRALGDDHLKTASLINNYGGLLRALGRSDEAETLHREALDTVNRIHGPDHPDSLLALRNLAADLHDLGRLEEATLLYRQVLDGRRRVMGDGHPSTGNALVILHSALLDQEKTSEARSLLESFLESADLPPNHPTVTGIRVWLDRE